MEFPKNTPLSMWNRDKSRLRQGLFENVKATEKNFVFWSREPVEVDLFPGFLFVAAFVRNSLKNNTRDFLAEGCARNCARVWNFSPMLKVAPEAIGQFGGTFFSLARIVPLIKFYVGIRKWPRLSSRDFAKIPRGAKNRVANFPRVRELRKFQRFISIVIRVGERVGSVA